MIFILSNIYMLYYFSLFGALSFVFIFVDILYMLYEHLHNIENMYY